jgi:hypothetical protein
MLAHCYISHCTPRPSPYAYKRKVQGPLTEGWPHGEGRDGAHKPLALSHADACNPLLQAHPTWARDKHEGRGFPLLRLSPSGFPPPPFALRLAPTHLGWGTRRQFTRRSRDPPGSRRRQICIARGCLRGCGGRAPSRPPVRRTTWRAAPIAELRLGRGVALLGGDIAGTRSASFD